MIKSDDTPSKQSLWQPFLTSSLQCWMFWLVYAHFVRWIGVSNLIPPLLHDPLFFCLPVFVALLGLVLVRHGKFKKHAQRVDAVASRRRLTVRLLSVSCFLVVGLILCIAIANSTAFMVAAVTVISKLGGLIETVSGLYSAIIFYIAISVFPIAYALAEYCFVPTRGQKP